MSYEKDTILNKLSSIHTGDLVLPAIQRDFVWNPERMYKLLDSIFRGYPFSTLMFWNTKQRIQYRKFTNEWSENWRPTYLIKEDGVKGSLVLDGQQRLQTLYLAIYGSYEQKILYFDLLSGNEPDDLSEARYHFEFISAVEVEQRNLENRGQQYWIPFRNLKDIDPENSLLVAQDYINKIGISIESDAGRRVPVNIALAINALKSEDSLNYYTIDKNFGEQGKITNLDEILEIFVRVNSGGEVLSKSDLMFSLMQMLWEDAADKITDLIETLNLKGHFDFDKDFILKCALVCCGQGAKYEVKKLRNEATVDQIKEAFPKICNALINFLEFLVSTACLVDDRIFNRAYNTFIPFVYYYYLQPSQQIKGEDTLLQMNRVLYLSLMTSFISRSADNHIDQIVHNILILSHRDRPGYFPEKEITKLIYSKQMKDQIDDWLLQNNITYLMNILEHGTRLPEGRRSRRPPEVDHIFPQSKLREQGISEEEINDFANLRLISQPDNNWKRAQDPKLYFDKNPGAAKRYLIPMDMLEYRQYVEFLEKRRALIWEHLDRFFGQDSSQSGRTPSSQSIKINAPIETRPTLFSNNSANSHHPTVLRLIVNEMLTQEQIALPILQDAAQWLEVFQEVRLSPQWCSRYNRALKDVGIRNVGDLAAAVIALNLKITHYSDNLPFYKFVSPLPNGTDLLLPTRDFGGYAWKVALSKLESRGFDWTKYLIK